MNKEVIEAVEAAVKLQIDTLKADMLAKSISPTDFAAEIEKMTTQLTQSKSDNEELKASIENLKEIVNLSREKESTGNISAYKSMYNAIDAVKEDVIALGKATTNNVKGISLEVKSAGTMMTTTNADGNVVRVENEGYEAPMSYKPSVWDVLVKRPTKAAEIKYVEKVEIEGEAGMVAEGGRKPDRSFKLVSRKIDIKKLAVVEKASKEMLEDVDSFYDFMTDDMTEACYDKLKKQALLGDGTGENLTGLMTIATPFVAPTIKVPFANMFDVVRLAGAQIVKEGGRPSHFAVSVQYAAQFDLLKDDSGAYILPPYSTASGASIKGMRMVEDVNLKDGEYLVWDNNRAKVRFREELNISSGFENEDFRNNLRMFIMEARLLLIVKEQYKKAFVKGDFATDITAINKPTTIAGK